MSNGAIVYRSSGGIDAIEQYSRRLAATLGVASIDARQTPLRSSPGLAAEGLDWVSVQYNPFSWGRGGFAPGLVDEALRLRRHTRAAVVLMVHEAWLEMKDGKSWLMGSWQRLQLRALLRLADVVMTSTQALAREIGRGAVHLPVPSNIPPIDLPASAARERLGLDGRLTVALFGRSHPSRALDHAEAAIEALAGAHGSERLAVFNLGAGAPRIRVPRGVLISTPGPQEPDELSLRLLASDLVLLPLTDGVSTRRSSLMAALAHGLPVVGCHGHNTDPVLGGAHEALVLTPAGDREAFARAAIDLAGDPARRELVGAAGRRLYESQFDWPVLATRITSLIERVPRPRPTRRPRRRAPRQRFTGARQVAVLAHDVGGPGGMERQTEQLVLRLLELGHEVTVIARTCELPERPGLRFVRVRTPSRPFVLAYPAFFVAGSLLARRRSHMLVHANGAIVARRVDVITVHYCHRSAPLRLTGLRASRSTPLHWLNALSARALSRAGEAWCYRPGRTRALCAVSAGVAAELRQGFPDMSPTVRTVPNGVDWKRFRPDPAGRTATREELGLGPGALLALFVGGDWERKGLPHLVDALSDAPDWHLAVAGSGRTGSYLERARRDGIESRIRFLGAIRDVQRLYAAADAFVLPTAYETFSLASFEAAASGLPLLVARVSGVEDLLHHGRNGWFIERDGRDIARCLNLLRANPALAARMGAEARAAAAAYSWEAMVEGYLRVYAEMAGGSN